MIDLQNVRVQVGQQVLLDVPSLSLKAGQFTAVLGPNGAGKSTLLKIFSGERKADSGRVLFQAKDLQSWETERLARVRAVLSQHYHISFPMQALDLVTMGRYPHIGSRPLSVRDHEIALESMQKLDVSHLSQRFMASLSGGEQQRMHMARVVSQIWDDGSMQPRLLLLDEPTASLDPEHQFTLLEVARSLAREGLCVAVVLHDINLAARYADHVVFLQQGRLHSSGPAAELLKEEYLKDIYGVDILRVHDDRLLYPHFVTRPHQR